MRILVLRGGALGDFIVTLPALRALVTRWPEAYVDLVGNRHAAMLGVIDGCLHGVHDQHEARWAPLFGDEPLPASLADWLSRFNLIVNYWPDRDGALARRFAAWGDRYVAGPASESARPAARRFLLPLQALGVEETELAPVIRLPADAMIEARQRIGAFDDFVALHAGSGSPAKTWPLARWHEVARRLKRPVLWITGEADAALAPPPDAPTIPASHWPLPVLGAALARCSCYLGHDTGISHLAGAAGARGVLLFGPTDPTIWAPPTTRLITLRSTVPAIEAITIEAVLAALPP